ncbi:Autophagy protein 7, partial [Dipsacomyces acuminosporus]
MSEILRFEPLNSTVEPEFWAGLAHHKLHSAQLDTARTRVSGEYSGGRRHAVRGGDTLAVPARFRVSKASWDRDTQADAGAQGASAGYSAPSSSLGPRVTVNGHLHNTNTIEDFKKADKGNLLRSAGAEILDDITSGRATEKPELLWPFLLLSFADLKKYRFCHWFAFPAITADPPDTVVSAIPASRFVSQQQSEPESLGAAFAQFSTQGKSSCGAFLAKFGHLTEWELFFGSASDAADEGSGIPLLGFVDPSSHSARPGWPLRNLLTWLRHCHPDVSRIRILCLRDGLLSSAGGAEPQYESIVLDVAVTPQSGLTSVSQVSGWERNDKQKLAPRIADLSSAMDPVRLAESALDLNLQLMRWRLAPSIDLNKIAETKALLVGAGTLGAYTARALLGWGVRKITFIDSGRVSFSNPPRQPLYTFADALGGGRPKAEAAAESMRQIFPSVDTTGVQLSIPMPGHTISKAESESTRSAVCKLEELVASHDVVFLLTDSRESRWLPTMLGALHKKIVVCVALGFDSYVAMRHGVYTADDAFEESEGSSESGAQHTRLGCYFCNDVVAPTDSLSDRTLDQQCTVTRPGLAPIASGTAVELLTTILQHPLGGQAPAPAAASSTHVQGADTSSAADNGVFGVPEHQIRGYLTGFRQHAIVGHASDMCTACSPRVLRAYREHGYEFLLRVFNNTLVAEDAPHVPIAETEDSATAMPESYRYLETLTGLAALHRQTDALLHDIELSEEGDSDDFEV